MLALLIYAVRNSSRPLLRPLAVRRCEAFLCRLRGLMGHPPLGPEEGLLLVGERESRWGTAIHMLFMRGDITAVWLDAAGRVVDVRLARRWRWMYLPARPARDVLEISPARREEFQIGDQLVLEEITLD